MSKVKLPLSMLFIVSSLSLLSFFSYYEDDDAVHATNKVKTCLEGESCHITFCTQDCNVSLTHGNSTNSNQHIISEMVEVPDQGYYGYGIYPSSYSNGFDYSEVYDDYSDEYYDDYEEMLEGDED
jgi:hypothetical protein